MLMQCTHLGLRLQLESVDSSRLDVASGVTVGASEEYTERFTMSYVCLAAEGDRYKAVVDVVQGASCD